MDAILRKALQKIKEDDSSKTEGEISDAILNEVSQYLDKEFGLHEQLRNSISEAIKNIKIDVPKSEITIPEIKIPEIKVPQITIPDIKLPTINVPEPKVTVNIPEIKVPEPKVTVNVPKADAPIVNVSPTPVTFPSEMSIKRENTPFPVVMVDQLGKPMQFPVSVGGGGGGRADFFTIKDIQTSSGASLIDQTEGALKVTGNFSVTSSATSTLAQLVNADGVYYDSTNPLPITGSLSTTPGATFYASDAVGSTNVIQIGGNTIATGSGVSGTGVQRFVHVSDVGMSVSVTDIFGSVATNLINPDNRLKVELPSGASGLTDTELRASSLLVEQVSGSSWSTNILGTVPVTGTFFQATQPVSVASTLDVQQVSGASWSTNVLSMPAVVVTSITNSVATSILNGDGTTLDPRNRNWTITETVPISSANTLDVKQVSGASDSVNVLSMPSVTVTSITNSTATALVDSTGIQYSGSNPIPTKEVRSTTPSQTSPSVGVASTSILASNTSRLGATIYNEGSAICYMKLGSTASLTSYSVQVASGGYYEVPFGYTGAIDGITSASTAQLRVTEIT